MEVIRAYNVGTTLYFPLIDKGATDFESTPVTIATGDCKISKDGGAFANTGSNFAHVAGGIYSLALTGTELSCKVAVVKIVDQTGTKEWEDQCIVIMMVNHASAEIPSLWAIPQSFAANSITAAAIADGAIDAATFAAGAINAAAIAADAITDAKVASDVTIASVTGAVGSVTGNVGGNVTGSVGSVAAGGITASSIATDALGALELASDAVSEIAAAVWDLATSGHVTSGTFGAQVKTLLDTVAGYIDTEVAAIKAKTDNLPSDPADASDILSATNTIAGYIDTEVAAIKAKTDNLPSDPASASTIATAFGVTNGKIDAVDDYVDTEVAAIKAKTDLIPASPAAVGDIPTAAEVAAEILTTDVDTVEGSAPVHSLTSVILKLVSRFVASTGVTYRTNGTTPHMTQTPIVDPSADPITELGAAS